MMLLSEIIDQFEAAFLGKYQERLLPSHKQALMRMNTCRTAFSPQMLARCSNDQCSHHRYIAHSCGHRNCPHCQHHESQQWIDNQLRKQLKARYYMVTFTLPREFRPLAWYNQKKVYHLLFRCVKEVLMSFAKNDKDLQGQAGFSAVLHTNKRNLGYHPHIHVVIPGAAINRKDRLWRVKSTPYLFNETALAKVFRGKFLQALTEEKLPFPKSYPEHWVVDCKEVGDGKKAIIYLGNYLYKGVIQEKNILRCENGWVTFQYKEARSKTLKTRRLKGEDFLWLLVRHVLPKGFRRVRDYGFLHGSAKRMFILLRLLFKVKEDSLAYVKQLRPRPAISCPRCGAPMKIVRTRIQRLPCTALSDST